MREQIAELIESYLRDRNSSQRLNELHYIERLKKIGINEDMAKSVLLNMDDAWVGEQLLDIQVKKAKTHRIISGLLAGIGGLVTIASFTDLFPGEGNYILMYGAIGSGIVLHIKSKSFQNSIEHERR